jgi:hypothetical protein
VQTSDSSSSAADRRQNPRTKLVEIAYIGMGPENGGLVLDVSEGGLSFHSVAPIQRDDKLRFLLSLRGHSRIEGTGEVVWTNQIGTVCGLKFTSLSPGALEHLNSWTNQSNTSAPARVKTAAAVRPIVSAAPKTNPPVLSILSAEPEFAIPSAVEREDAVHITEMRGQSPLFWMAVGALSMLFASLTFWYGIRVGKAEFSAPKATAAATDTQANAPIVPSLPVPAARIAVDSRPTQMNLPGPSKFPSPVPAHALVNASRIEGISGPVATVPAAPVPAAPTPVAAASPVTAVASAAKAPSEAAKPDRAADANPHSSAGTAESEYAAALADLNGDNGKRDTDSAIRLLHIAVKKGNTMAEVTLADLYIYGDGVAQDCDHGKSLLAEASKRGDAQATVKLAELNAGGCP